MCTPRFHHLQGLGSVTGTRKRMHKHVDRCNTSKTQQLYKDVGSKKRCCDHAYGQLSLQRATGCSIELVIRQQLGSCNKTMFQLTRPGTVACIAASIPGGHLLEHSPYSPDLCGMQAELCAADSCSRACSHRLFGQHDWSAARAVAQCMRMHCHQGSFVAAHLVSAQAAGL